MLLVVHLWLLKHRVIVCYIWIKMVKQEALTLFDICSLKPMQSGYLYMGGMREESLLPVLGQTLSTISHQSGARLSASS